MIVLNQRSNHSYPLSLTSRDVYGLSGVLALTCILSKKQVFEEFLLNELENVIFDVYG